MKRSLLVLAVVLGTCAATQAQGDSTSYGGLPALGYTSDMGFVAGGILTRFDYASGYRPYRSSQYLSLIWSSKGFYAVSAQSEWTRLNRLGLRASAEVFATRTNEDTWFGLGNRTAFDADSLEAGAYYYESRNAGLRLKGRLPVFRAGYPGAQLDLTVSGEYRYDAPVGGHAPAGARAVTKLIGGVGLLWENRDSETDPSRGNRAEVEYAYHGGHRFGYELVQLVPIRLGLRWVAVARVGGAHVEGPTPWYMMPGIAVEQGGAPVNVRGYVLNRFRGNTAAWTNLELRTWFWEDRELKLKLGAQVFTDAGRVWMGRIGNNLTQDWHRTWGGGLAVSLFTPDFIIRLDQGMSEDIGRFYMSVGHFF